MKRSLLLLLALGGIFSLSAEENKVLGQYLPCERKYEMRTGVPKFMDHIKLVPGGVTGKCFHLTLPAGAKSLYFHPWTEPRVKVPFTSSPVRVSCDVKGKGKIRIGFTSWDKNGKIFYPPNTGKTFSLTPQWKNIQFTYTPKAGSAYANRTFWIHLSVTLLKDSEAYTDNFRIEFLNVKPSIKIEK